MLQSFIKSKSGNFAIYASVVMGVVLLAISVSLDIGRAQKLKSSLQDVADAALLAAAKSRPKEQGAMQAVANDYLRENDRTGLAPSGTVTLSADKKTLSIDMGGTYDTSMMKMFGKPTIGINVTAETLIEVTNYTDIVLVLDTTGSMGVENRLPNLKVAAQKLIDVIDDIDSDRIRMSVVPFAKYVNVGMGVRNQPWIDVPADWTEYFPDTCTTNTPVVGQTNCRDQTFGPTPARPGTPGTPPTYGTCYRDGVPYSCQTSSGSSGSSGTPARPGGTREVCDPVYGAPQTTCTPNPPVVHRWHGCVGSRAGNDNLKASYSSGESKVPGYLDLTCGSPVLPLTTNLGSSRSKVNSLSPNGLTYGPAGLIWGWRMLDQNEPFANSRTIPSGATLDKVAIFMTDGHNTASRNGQKHNGTSRNDADNTAATICERMKEDSDINIYTVTFKVADNSAKELVRECASDDTQYYDANSASTLLSAFEDIGYALLSPRITR